ncbi:Xaa-Pro peptidase family protein [Desulfopila sp. IMCC35008]|uniref:M24 family metallopeptidase n=1 Tax=Desulfopila sp. IMCC35008 TaxID=2653858 RepID=UPI00197AE62E|nr:Xaa-Pro peptidase family protein [Desulfopila sp. IMCC35008]
MMAQSRLDRLYSYMEEAGLHALAINAGPTMTYLSGLQFHLMERPVVMILTTSDAPTIILPQLEQRKLADLDWDPRVFTYDENPERWQAVFATALADLGLAGRRVGVEPNRMRLLEYNYLKGAIAADYTDGSGVSARLRMQKDEAEIANMREAVRIAQDALTATLPMIAAGVREQDIASELVLQLLRNGSEGTLPFSPIVAGGPNGANPHAKPGERILRHGDLLIIDWGASFNGYVSDLTRTFAIGEVDEESRRIHDLVHRANRAGREAGRAGVPCATVDRAAREVIEEGGYGSLFHHRTGHGIGMECHEDPYMHGENEQVLEVGMAYTVEPGIYIAGKNGVRIEDDVIITEKGAESLSTMSRELTTIG